jgi:hypothetical protein
MINKLLLAGLGLVSSMAYAESITTTTQNNPLSSVLDYTDKVSADYYYDYSVKNKNGNINFYVTTKLGEVIPFSATSGVDEACRLQIKNAMGSTEIALGALPSSGVQVTILPVKNKDGVVQTLIDLNDTKYVNKENPQVINETCSIANTLSTTTSVRWLGDLSFDKEKTIKMSNGDELYITLSQHTTKK